MTLEEALAKVKELEEKNAKILNEKKEMLKLFEDKDKEEMTDMEKKMAKILEEEGAKRTELEKKLEAEQKAREKFEADRTKAETERTQKALTERLTKVAKGDTEVLKKLQANLELLSALPKQTDSELDTAVNMAYNMMGAGSVNPLSATNVTSNNNPNLDAPTPFSTTDAGKAVAGKLGMKFLEVDKAGEGDKK
jgi:hypothetical protein